jgi:uncharacterized protein (DUF2345 family)
MTTITDRFPTFNPFIMDGTVVSTADPDQMGRVRVWVPALDGDDFVIEQLAWAEYVSPLMGFTVDYQAGEGNAQNTSQAAYGFWAIPKVGSEVMIFCKNGDPRKRCYFAASMGLHTNRSLPAGRNVDTLGNQGPFGDSGDGTGKLNPIQPAYNNLRTQFENKITASEAQTRGAYERQAAQPGENKDGSEGYSTSPADATYLDPQTYCLVTPGRNAIILQDDPAHARLRFKTAEGHQIILDDANERIYISTSQGASWIEMDQDGHINIYGTDSVSLRSGKDINFYADGNINFEAKGGINMIAVNNDVRITAGSHFQVQATKNIVQTACGLFDVDAESGMHLSATGNIDMKATNALNATGIASIDMRTGGDLKATGSKGVDILGGPVKIGGLTVDIGATAGNVTISGNSVSIDGPPAMPPTSAQTAAGASCADQATGPAIVPGHEPWTRPTSTTKRGQYWKP